MRRTSQKKPYSLKKRIFFVFVSTYLLLSAVVLVIGLLFYRMALRRSEESYSMLAETTSTQLDNDLTTTQNFVLTTMINHPDLTLLETETDPIEFSLTQARFVNYLQDYIPSLSTTSGVFFYISKLNSFMFAQNRTSTASYAIKDEMRGQKPQEMLKSIRSSYKKWRFAELDDEYYLVKYLTYNGRVGGAWVSSSTLISNYATFRSDTEALVFFASKTDGSIYAADSRLEGFSYDPANKRCTALLGGKKTEFLQVSAELKHCDENMVILVPVKNIRHDLRLYYMAGYITFAILMVGFALFYVLIRRNLSAPINDLRRVSDAIRKGEEDAKVLDDLLQDARSIEVQEITRELGDLIEQLSALKNRVLMEQYARNSFELQSLKNQVSPHFLINSLSTLSSLNNISANQELVKTLIALLAAHLRYTLSAKNTVSISEEVLHLQDYYKMMQIRYPNSLQYEINIQGLCDDASIFPSLILMLSENSVKHNLAVGEMLMISVTAREEMKDGVNMVRITHTDSGKGFAPETLETLNQLKDATPETIADGQNIGMYNIVKRLYLAYRDKDCSITFSNQETGGAKIEILIPYIPFQES